MEPRELKVGEVVQLNPETTRNKAFRACLMVVSDPKSFGAQGYVQSLGNTRDEMGGQAYYRANWDEMEPLLLVMPGVATVVWDIKGHQEDAEGENNGQIT